MEDDEKASSAGHQKKNNIFEDDNINQFGWTILIVRSYLFIVTFRKILHLHEILLRQWTCL